MKHKPRPARNISAPVSPRLSISAPLMPAPLENYKPAATSPSPTETPETPPKTLGETRRTPSAQHCSPTNGNGRVTESFKWPLAKQSNSSVWHKIHE